jgi:hypothetical protein
MPFHFSPLISLRSANTCTVHSHDDDDVLYHNGSIRLAACFKSITSVNSFSNLKHIQARIKQVFLGNIWELLPCQWIYNSRMQSCLSFPMGCMDCTSIQHTIHWHTSINSIRQELYALLLKYTPVCTETTERSPMDGGGGDDGTRCTPITGNSSSLHQPCWPMSTSPMCLSLIMVIATSVVNIMGTQQSGI